MQGENRPKVVPQSPGLVDRRGRDHWRGLGGRPESEKGCPCDGGAAKRKRNPVVESCAGMIKKNTCTSAALGRYIVSSF